MWSIWRLTTSRDMSGLSRPSSRKKQVAKVQTRPCHRTFANRAQLPVCQIAAGIADQHGHWNGWRPAAHRSVWPPPRSPASFRWLRSSMIRKRIALPHKIAAQIGVSPGPVSGPVDGNRNGTPWAKIVGRLQTGTKGPQTQWRGTECKCVQIGADGFRPLEVKHPGNRRSAAIGGPDVACDGPAPAELPLRRRAPSTADGPASRSATGCAASVADQCRASGKS